MNLAAAFSLAVCLIAVGGYFGTFGVYVDVWQPSYAIDVVGYSLKLDRGGIEMSKSSEPPFYMGPRACPSSGLVDGQFGLADFRSFSRFDFQHSQITKRGVTATSFAFTFPIWCILLPCLIAPVLWWRKRRRLQRVGFAVVTDHRDGA
jgi:hypothetical protein